MVDQFSKGMFLIIDGALCVVEDRKYKTQGRQGGLIILTYKNIETKQSLTKTVKAGTKMEQVQPDYREMQFSYTDGDDIYFMDMETYETVAISNELIGDYAQFLKEGDTNVLMLYEGKPVSMRKNQTVELEVTEAVDAVKGNTSGNATKKVTTQTGLVVDVPMFINKGDVIVVNTETSTYTSRVN